MNWVEEDPQVLAMARAQVGSLAFATATVSISIDRLCKKALDGRRAGVVNCTA